ncbi:MAG: HepT-like ribonuclease domain-containing protein [Thermoproteota archaeon]
MKREFLDYIEDIIEAMEDSMSFVKDTNYDDFVKDKMKIYAAIRAIEVIGEAVKKIPKSVKNRYTEIPWKDMAGMRDKLIHEYFGVDLRRVWKTVKEDIPNLKPLFEKILKDFE